MDVWESFGFTQNPYATSPIAPSEYGDYLLVGREEEVSDLIARLTASTAIPVLVGANGVGKTSIVSVALHRMRKSSSGRWPRYLYVYPPLQLPTHEDVNSLAQATYYQVAKALLDEKSLLTECGVKARDVRSLSKWLKDPTTRQHSFGLSTPFGGASMQTGSTPSDSEGFKSFGLNMMLDEWLGACFPEPESGGVVCVIDNLEILKSSSRARETIESLRDSLFSQTGLRWILSGTPAVAGGAALFSARMEGRISQPVEIRPLDPQVAPELISRRLHLYGVSNSYPPVDEVGFQRIYAVVNSRLRSALDLCQQYAVYLHLQGRRPDAQTRVEVLDRWLAARAAEFSPATRDVGARAWRLFDELADLGGEVRGLDSQLLRFGTPQELDSAAVALRSAGLVERVSRDGDDFVLEITTPGWLVSFERSNYAV